MKKQILLLACFAVILTSLIYSCDKKKPSSGISPTYGTTGNPNPGNVTVTGSTTYSNPATENTSMYVGGSGWTNPTCGSTNSITLKGYNGNVEVTVSFANIATSGTYAIAPNPGPNTCALKVLNAPNQPAGIEWIGKSGTIVVNTTSSSINAAFNGIACTQANFNFPSVTVSGQLGCNQ